MAGFSYVTTAPEAVENFRHVGYPQQLRVLLGIAKLAGAIVLLLPRLPTLKEWAYAGFTFMWIAATVAHYLAGDGIVLVAGRVARAAGGFVRDAPGESPRFREVDAGVASRAGVRSLRFDGIPERVAMRLTGHKTASVFQRYNIVSDNDLREAAIKMERVSRAMTQEAENIFTKVLV